MKKHLLGGAAFIALGIGAWGLGAPAVAADIPDIPVKAPVSFFSWTGCYVGSHTGLGWGRKDFSDPTGINCALNQVILNNVGGVLSGVQAGCDYQLAPNWVAGAEADFSLAYIRGTVTDPFFNGKSNSLQAKTDWLATATGRLGYTFDRTLIYAKGGAAWARDRYIIGDPNNNPNNQATAAETRFGWIIGFGIEQALWDSWSVKVEFDHYEFGTRRLNFTNPLGFPATAVVDIRQRIEAVKIGINYRFGPAGPVTARY
jgi:outer membrane immunogenic protein